MKLRTAVIAAPVALLAATGCSPTDWHTYMIGPKAPNGQYQGYHADAAAGPNDGGGSRFAVQVVCTGEAFWRTGNWISVDTTPNWPNNRFRSEVYCPAGHYVTGTNVRRVQ